MEERAEYLGTSAIFSGHSSDFRNEVLAAGDSQITGKARLQDRPVAGLKLRLSLNGKVMSQWGTTDSTGSYSISVPAGRYQVTGYELDHASPDRVLAGKIMRPQRETLDSTLIQAAPDKVASGPDLDFTEPVVLTGPVGDQSSNAKVIITWQPFPGAASYRVQLDESERRTQFFGETKFVYDWASRPLVSSNSFDVSSAQAKLKPGYYYHARVEALGANGKVISETPNGKGNLGFRMPAT